LWIEFALLGSYSADQISGTLSFCEFDILNPESYVSFELARNAFKYRELSLQERMTRYGMRKRRFCFVSIKGKNLGGAATHLVFLFSFSVIFPVPFHILYIPKNPSFEVAVSLAAARNYSSF
jgi:hypothetical protein